MLDCGFTLKELERRLARLHRTAADVSAILITHEHGDHVSGAVRFARRHDIELWMTPGTRAVLRGVERARVRNVNCHEPFEIGDLHIEPTPVPHDAREPCQYVFGNGARRLGVLTDTGHVSPHMLSVYAGCDALALECNHEHALLEAGPYPRSLKARVGSRFGHLNNGQAAAMLRDVDCSQLSHIVAVHLSEKNNTPMHARAALAQALNCEADDIAVAGQDAGLGWRDVG